GFYTAFKPIPFMPFVPAIAVCAGFGGLGPGLLALSLSALGATYLFTLQDPGDSQIAQLLFFMASAAVITVLSTLLRRAYGPPTTAGELAQTAGEAVELRR